ncbi:MAG: PRD domain-containing protein [Oscillospiraceae bacterium]|nr:PRD domain-containing protein [Oscillospiraceae bacterium]
MRIRQIINNNTIFSEDAQGNELIVMGKGIGFQGRRGEEVDPGAVEKVFVLKNETEKNKYLTMTEDIPYEVISFGIRVSDYIVSCGAKAIQKDHLMLPLVDHIYTTLERYKKGIRFDNTVLWNLRVLYPEEYKIAQDVTDMMISAFNLPIDESEANYITLHIINAELDLDPQDGYKATGIIDLAMSTVEEFFGTALDRDSVDLARFISHLQFFAKRMLKNVLWNGEDELSLMVRHQYKEAYECAGQIIQRLEKSYGIPIHEEERTYLTIHIARLMKPGE